MGAVGRIGRTNLSPDEQKRAAAERDVANIRKAVEGAENAIRQQTAVRDAALVSLAEAEARLAGLSRD